MSISYLYRLHRATIQYLSASDNTASSSSCYERTGYLPWLPVICQDITNMQSAATAASLPLDRRLRWKLHHAWWFLRRRHGVADLTQWRAEDHAFLWKSEWSVVFPLHDDRRWSGWNVIQIGTKNWGGYSYIISTGIQRYLIVFTKIVVWGMIYWAHKTPVCESRVRAVFAHCWS